MANLNTAPQPSSPKKTGSNEEAENFNSSDFLNVLQSKDIGNLLKSGESISHTHLSKLLASNETSSRLPTASETTTTATAKKASTSTNEEPPKATRPQPDVFNSKDWMSAYALGHQDVPFAGLFKSSESMGSFHGPFLPPPVGGSADWMSMYASANPMPGYAGAAAAAAPPAVDWMAMYESTWQNPLQPLKMPPLPNTSTATTASPVLSSPKKAGTTKLATRKRKNTEPERKQYVECSDNDVLLGRGGKANKHPGNIRYRYKIEKTKEWYRNTSKKEKTDVSQHLVDWVQNQNGRFLKKDPASDRWFVVSNTVARKKASQALREENTPEARAAKRAKYTKKENPRQNV